MDERTPPATVGHIAVMEEHNRPSLDNLPLECIQVILENLSTDCHALHSLLLMNRSWFRTVLPFLYRSPITLIDATWPKLSSYSQVLKKDLPPSSPSSMETQTATTSDETRSRSETTEAPVAYSTRSGRSPSNTRRTSTTSSSNGGHGFGYAPRTHSRSSSHSSTRSWTGDAFHHGRNEAVIQKDQRERLVKRKKMQVLWVFLNCTLSEEERGARNTLLTAGSGKDDERHLHAKTVVSSSSLLSLDIGPDLDIEAEYFKPMVDYLTYYTHLHHPGLRFIVWKLFPDIDDAFTIEWRLISHCPERIRELFLESVQLQDVVPLVSRLKTLHRIKACHETWDVPGSIEFMKLHNKLFGTVRMLELEAYLPDKHETAMDDNLSYLISQVERLKVLEIAGFKSLRAQLDLIPRRDLKVFRLNCGTLGTEYPPTSILTMSDEAANSNSLHDGAVESSEGAQDRRMTISTFLSQCRRLEELVIDPIDEDVLEWAVQERQHFQAGLLTSISSSPNPSVPLAHEPAPAPVPLKVLELSGEDCERVAMTVSQAAEAFQDTLEVIKANSYSYRSNRTQTHLSWRCPLPQLRVLKVVGRSNLPLDFRSLQYCPALRTLDLSKYSGMRACSEAALLNLKYLTRLEYLGLSSFDHLTDSTLRTILGCMPRLKHLRLAIGDSSMTTLASGALSSATGSGAGSSSMSANAASSSKGAGVMRGSGILGIGTGGTSLAGGSGNGASGSGSGSGSISNNTDMLNRSPFAALSLSSSLAASSASSPASPSLTTSPIPLAQHPHHVDQQQQQLLHSPSSYYVVTGHVHNQFSQHSSRHVPPPPPPTASSSYIASSSSNSNNIFGGGGNGEVSSSARSTSSSSLMDRFHLENNFLSLEGILDAIDGLSESKNQLERLSIVLGKLDFEEHYRRLEQYNQLHLDLEITVYRYAHIV